MESTWTNAQNKCLVANIWAHWMLTAPRKKAMRNCKLISIFCCACYENAIFGVFLRSKKWSSFCSSLIWIMHHCVHLSRSTKTMLHLKLWARIPTVIIRPYVTEIDFKCSSVLLFLVSNCISIANKKKQDW